MFFQQLFEDINNGRADSVRDRLAADKSLVTCKLKGSYHFEADVESDAYKFLGAYVGHVTPLQAALFSQEEGIAKDVRIKW